LDSSSSVPLFKGVGAMNRKVLWVLLLVAIFSSSLFSNSFARKKEIDIQWQKNADYLQKIWVTDGTPVMNVGNLQMHVCNWGCFGSYPGSTLPFSEAPSAQWPANSGVEYLYIAGLWVGAKKNGVPVVSTAAYEWEFQPDPYDENQKVYRTFEGALGGARFPTPADDDNDGLIDEDWLNGEDDDGDGRIDEDFAAIGKEMLVCWFTDDTPASVQRYPEHTPLHLKVRQESYQWEEEKYYNFVGVEYRITNYGKESVEDVYIGFFADGDAGPRTREKYWEDDITGLWEGIVCGDRGGKQIPIRVSVAWFADDDGDEGKTEGYLGVLFLGHDVDPLGENAPKKVGITSYQNFSGQADFEQGGDPRNDEQRYKLMSEGGKDKDAQVRRDYRMLLAVGPFKELPPDSTMVLQVAFVCGKGLDGMLKSAASAALAFQGNWFNVDGNDETGIKGRETPVYGPVDNVEPDSCDDVQEIVAAARGEIIWINADCREELELWNDTHCNKGNATFKDYQTGVDGKETQVHWLVGSAPPPPHMRLLPGDGKVTILWDNYSEVTPDVSTLEYDFEGYRIWRADGWDRPFGTSILTGPERELWQLLEERDYVNGVPPDRDFRKPFAEGGWEYEPLLELGDKKYEILRYFEESVYYSPTDTVPCPPGLTDSECDTLEALARYNLGFEGGLQFYKYVDNTVHNGMHYFYAVTAYDHIFDDNNQPYKVGYYGDPSSNFQYIVPLSDAQDAEEFDENEVYVVPNPATKESMAPWTLQPNQDDPTGIKVEFRNLPRCRGTVRIYTVSGDLVQVLYFDGTTGHGTLPWDLVSRNGQDITSGIYLFAVEPDDSRFPRTIGKFVVIR